MAASFDRIEPPGRAKNQVPAAIATTAKIAHESKTVAASCAESSPRSRPLRAWKIDQSIHQTLTTAGRISPSRIAVLFRPIR
ncbi:MAG TPA: hypothetical protein VJT84_02760 [Gaiellaceae bacterium]|nr:hypothetical protein [Gaiellaceae bacterium]